MIKTTKKEIRRLTRTGAAADITYSSFSAVDAIARDDVPEKIAYSTGKNGINAALYRGRRTRKLYAVTARTTAIFQLE